MPPRDGRPLQSLEGTKSESDPVLIFDARSASMPRTTGWERYARELARRIVCDPSVTIWSPPITSLPSRLVSDLAARRLTKNAVVHFPTFPPLYPYSGSNFILTVHDLTWWKYPETSSSLGRNYYRPLLERAIPRARALMTHSVTVAAELVDYFGVDEKVVRPVFCGADSLSHLIPDQGLVPDRPYLLTVGSVEPRKNLGRLVLAYKASGIAKHYELVIVGRSAWGETPRGVTVLNDTTDRQLKGLYESAEAVLMPSLYEGLGLPIIEAMAMQVPVMCSDIPVFREVAADYAIYFDPLSVESIVDALRQVSDLKGLPHSVVHEVRTRYSWADVAQRILHVYDDVVAHNR